MGAVQPVVVDPRRLLVAGAIALLLLFASALAIATLVDARVVPSGPRPSVAAGSVMVAIYDGIELGALESQISPYMQPGDGVAAVVHGSNPATVNSWAVALQHYLPSPSYTYRAYWGLGGLLGTPGIGNLSPTFSQVSADWEVNGPSQFRANPFCTPYWPANSSYMTTCQYFQSFASQVNQSGRQPVAYVTGQGIFGDYARYNWNYGIIDGITSAETVETQGYAGNLAQWEKALGKIASQFQAQGRPLSQLSVQVSVGTGGNGVSVNSAVTAIDFAYSIGIPQVFLWFGDKTGPWAASVLSQINRATPLGSFSTLPVPPAPSGLTVTNVQSQGAYFSWTNPAGISVVGNTIYLGPAGDCGNWTIVATGPSSSSALLVNLTPSTSYCATVTDRNASGESAWSGTVDFTTTPPLDSISALFVSGATGGVTVQFVTVALAGVLLGAVALEEYFRREQKR